MKQKSKFKQTEIGMIPEDWEVVNLKDNCELIQYGYTATASEEPIGPKFLRGTDIRNKIINWDDVPYCKIEGDNIKKYRLYPGDIVITRMGSPGDSAYFDKEFTVVFASYLIRIRLNKTLYSKFIYYYLQSRGYREFIKRLVSTSATPGANAQSLTNVDIPKPYFIEQQHIVKILSDLDSKIELNQQINKILEAIGQAIFKHWFIDFEFPNEKGEPYKSSGGEMVDSGLGKIPKGWRVSIIGKECISILGGTPDRTKEEYWNGDINWINSGKVNEFRIIEPSEKITKLGLDKSATKLLPKGTVVLAITGATLGQVSRLEIDSCANQSVIGILENNKLPSTFLYYWITKTIHDIIRWQTGGAQQHINKGNVENSKILIPHDNTLKIYSKLISNIFNKISVNCFESKDLSKIRDSLLPRLMSGKIRVPVEVRV